MPESLYTAAERLVEWLDSEVTAAGRGSGIERLEVEPAGNFWLGRLATEEGVVQRGLGERGERLDPCAMGMRLLASGPPPWTFNVTVHARVWLQGGEPPWTKSSLLNVEVPIQIDTNEFAEYEFGREALTAGLSQVTNEQGLEAIVHVEARPIPDGSAELTILAVNKSPLEHPVLKDTNLYEVALMVEGLATRPFLLESLPDSFRYDRRVEAYGVNCGVARSDTMVFRTTDTVEASRGRPEYWNTDGPEPDLRFSTLSLDAIPSIRALVIALSGWAETAWSETVLASRAEAEGWSESMRSNASEEAQRFFAELGRLERGLQLLEDEPELRRAFQLMNEAMAHSANGKYDSWRPFQVGFLVANIACLLDREVEARIADVVWFATGGGKTETYLGLLVTAALLERLRGRESGITAWSRFPLRMLSLQQTQRFADAMAGAELVRRRAGIAGHPFSVGFFVGQGGTPNRVPQEPARDWEPDPDDDDMPRRFRVLTTCPYCHADTIEMAFDRLTWCLEHRCTNDRCPWPERRLPFYIVDDEIYRFLPTIVVGTLDKAASIALQASMRGFVGPPHGVCSEEGHGFTYAPRQTRPNGCLVPGCPGSRSPVLQAAEDYAPRFRLQDELHLLKDSLGAVDAQYEALFDHLQKELTGTEPKILASSATLTGYEHQVRVLYQRDARVFPLPGPSPTESFWTRESANLARKFVAVAPRGQTLEFAIDKMLTHLQGAVRRLRNDPDAVCADAGIDPCHSADLISLYGTDVVYGNTLRDLEAALRSADTQVNVDGPLNTAPLTGRTPFDEVRHTLSRLEQPELAFDDRIHIIGASSMMSHGVDIDRLNVMVMLGLPLTTAEFIQTTARIGRKWPGLAYVVTKIARERDAAVFRSFESFIKHGDRFVEPVPVTRRSRRVLERTLPGTELARILTVHEPRSNRSLATVRALRDYCEAYGVGADSELAAVLDGMRLSGPLDQALTNDIEQWLEEFYHTLFNPVGDVRFPRDLCPGERRPMLSLRDVEEQAPVRGTLS